MKKEILSQLHCPYCLSSFEIEKIVEGDADRIKFGLIRCRCFSFPIVHGVLLLALTKGYGGSEEHIQPYVPLQAAAIEYLRNNQLDQLHQWIRRHLPLLAELVETPGLSYAGFMRSYSKRLSGQIQKDLYDAGRFEVLGKAGAVRKLSSLKAKLGASRAGSVYVSLREWFFPQIFKIWYVKRYASGELMETREILRTLPLDGPILSLCCGHGIFEFLTGSIDPTVHDRTVSIDGQLLNLFVVRKFIAPSATFICHDVQFPLPFQDGAFDTVASCACLAEIPNRASFIRESLRLTSEDGWCLFDGVSNATSEGDRVNPSRYWRYCQNEMCRISDYFKLIQQCAEKKEVQVMVVQDDKVLQETEPAKVQELLGANFSASFLVVSAQSPLLRQRECRFEGMTNSERNQLYLSPRFDRYRRTGEREFVYTSEEDGKTVLVQVRDADDKANLSDLMKRGVVALLPDQFAPDQSSRKFKF